MGSFHFTTTQDWLSSNLAFSISLSLPLSNRFCREKVQPAILTAFCRIAETNEKKSRYAGMPKVQVTQAAHPSYESRWSTDSLVVSSVPTPTPAVPECSQFCALPACGRICVNSEFPFQPNINGITKKLVKSTEKVQRRKTCRVKRIRRIVVDNKTNLGNCLGQATEYR